MAAAECNDSRLRQHEIVKVGYRTSEDGIGRVTPPTNSVMMVRFCDSWRQGRTLNLSA
ncbi:predicted protein [Sclerotinia sclerotiorum 1980 UF-70]|uniref:Uncharacterized protein n=1 Tax=Sclerotinia sclerotiorum (strain ATCC 18683 / 1980 / Ss-1) TaxID=665079 RepID=A7EWE2_SCLS1|nr:predicted protein [Sclerotinia sclerotiorum 1980 UF-70]EDN93784.1 predicted protein [Sclerotinia sclerotiorum 1980 UF-70]